MRPFNQALFPPISACCASRSVIISVMGSMGEGRNPQRS
jgi:hypothetical protein